jgi:uncharacterized membrane protein YoaK (UPF0700 family)
MFRHQGPGRTERQNGILAAYLAVVAGYVNSAGFVLIGTFTSHVTGNVGRVANDLATEKLGAAAAALSMIAAFFVGAFFASMLIETNLVGRTAVAYGLALSMEALLLLGFIGLASLPIGPHPRFHDLQGAVLCMAMGAQNCLVTRLSGAVVRTTHLTGVVTDLGIEAARWFRFWRSRLSSELQIKLSFGRNPVERPQLARTRLLVTIVLAFMLGAFLGAAAGAWLRASAFWLPCAAISLSAAYAFVTGRRPDSLPPARSGARIG